MWPGVLMTVISSAWKAKSGVTRDVTDGLYSKTAYAVAKGLLNLVSSGGVFLAYAVPGYLLAGLHYPQQDDDLDVFYFYIGKKSGGTLPNLKATNFYSTSILFPSPRLHVALSVCHSIVELGCDQPGQLPAPLCRSDGCDKPLLIPGLGSCRPSRRGGHLGSMVTLCQPIMVDATSLVAGKK